MEVLLGAVFSFGSAPRLYNEDPGPIEGIENLVGQAVLYWNLEGRT
jgi:hypothetical protein